MVLGARSFDSPSPPGRGRHLQGPVGEWGQGQGREPRRVCVFGGTGVEVGATGGLGAALGPTWVTSSPPRLRAPPPPPTRVSTGDVGDEPRRASTGSTPRTGEHRGCQRRRRGRRGRKGVEKFIAGASPKSALFMKKIFFFLFLLLWGRKQRE